MIHQDSKRNIFMYASIVLGVGLLVIDSWAFPGWISAAYWGYGLSLLYLVYAILARDNFVGCIWVFGLAAGLAELASDHWLVAYTGTLVYPPAEPMWWSSPIYMPFSWLVVLMQLCFLASQILPRLAIWQVSLAIAVFGGVMIPLYEHWAINAKWWNYINTPKFFDVPYYIMLAEAILVLPLPYIVRILPKHSYIVAILVGLLEGVVMLLACFIAFFLVGR